MAKDIFGNETYDDEFYREQMDGSYRSALVYARHLTRVFTPSSVVDVGCGRGSWLRAFRECGSMKLVGYDGPWNSGEQMCDPAIQYIPTDLSQPLGGVKSRFDLAISLEVAEHLHEAASNTMVRNLAALSDVVMFAAACKNQGGVNHVNEQPQTYWARKFIETGYQPYDVFRPSLWGTPGVQFWYQQNTFLYVKRTSSMNQNLEHAGFKPISNLEFMNCVHPVLYESWVSRALNPTGPLKSALYKMIPKTLRPFVGGLKKLLG